MTTPMCVLCKEPASLCQCSAEVRAFGDAHIHTHDGERALIDGETLRVLIERAQAWGRHQSEQLLRPEAGVAWKPTAAKYEDPICWRSNTTDKIIVCAMAGGKTYQIELPPPPQGGSE